MGFAERFMTLAAKAELAESGESKEQKSRKVRFRLLSLFYDIYRMGFYSAGKQVQYLGTLRHLMEALLPNLLEIC
jgi:hypothetical protein